MGAELSLREVCELFGVSADTVRRWEKEGRIPAARRNSGNHRRWDALQMSRLKPWERRPAPMPSWDFVSAAKLAKWDRSAWVAKCQAPECECVASNATMYVSGGDMGPRVFFWCHKHRGGLGETGNISGADDGKVLPVQTLLGAIRAAVRQTRNKALIKHLVAQFLSAKGIGNG